MSVKEEQLYQEFQNQIVTFNQKVILEMGILTDQISFKCGGKKFPCIIYSSSMNDARIMVYLSKEDFTLIADNKKRIALYYALLPSGSNRAIHFFVNSRIENVAKYEGGKENLFILQIRYQNRPSSDLIFALGNHLKEQASQQKRMEKRIELRSEDDELLGLDSMQSVLYIQGKRLHCVLTEISIFSAKVLIQGNLSSLKAEDKVMLIMKARGLDGLGEMLGSIERIDSIKPQEELYSLIINFDQENIPPTYKLWVAECIELVHK